MRSVACLPNRARYSGSRFAFFCRHWQTLLEVVFLLAPRILAGRRRIKTDTSAAVLAVLLADIDC